MKLTHSVKSKISSVKGVNWLKVLVVLATIVIGVLYIWQVNVAATRGFTMRDLEQEIEQMQHENERLQMEVARFQSVESVTTRMQMLGLVEPGEVEYMGGTEAVAVNR